MCVILLINLLIKIRPRPFKNMIKIAESKFFKRPERKVCFFDTHLPQQQNIVLPSNNNCVLITMTSLRDTKNVCHKNDDLLINQEYFKPRPVRNMIKNNTGNMYMWQVEV